MGRSFDAIPDHLVSWMEEQPIFFVASAPLDPEGLVNVSPKGGDTFRVVDQSTVVYQDLTGSGAETIAHTRENGRLTIMFCSFGEKPNIVRLFGRGGPLALAVALNAVFDGADDTRPSRVVLQTPVRA